VIIPLLYFVPGFTGREPPPFDGARAFEILEAQCALGPRVPGTEAHRECRRLIEERLRTLAPRVEVRDVRTRSGWGDEMTGWNILGFYGKRGAPLLIGAHWDSRARADLDPEPVKRLDPVMGANDGASGVAVLLELARLFSEVPPPRRVILAFFVLEDQGIPGDPDGYCVGSRAAAAELAVVPGGEAIIVDMVGGRSMRLLQEGYSLDLARPLVERLWSLAAATGSAAFVPSPGGYTVDDHLAFLRAGWAAVDIIDQDYPQWHTTGDLPEACSPASLAAVGDVLRCYIYRLEPSRSRGAGS
jgi:hypothetical protein